MKIVKFFGSLVLLAIVMSIAANYSTVDYRYKCDGTITRQGITKPITLFIKIEKWRWWNRPWFKTHGVLWYEIPNEDNGAFTVIQKIGDNYLIYEYDNHYKGKFSTLSNHLVLELHSGVVDTYCVEVHR